MEAASDVALAGLTLLATLAFLLTSVALVERATRRGARARPHHWMRHDRPILPIRRRG